MSRAALSTTTLSAAITNKQTRFAVASTTGISGLGSLTTQQSVLVVGAEKMLVQNVPVSGVVEVMRGFDGTKAAEHASGTTVTIAAKTDIGFAENAYAVPLVGLTGDPGAKPGFALPVGQYRMDPETGYVYQLVDCQAAFQVGEWVVVDGNGLASQLAATSKGRVRIIVETIGSSDTLTWALARGTYASALFTSGVTTAVQLGADTGCAAPFSSANDVLIERATCTVAPSTATSPSVGGAVGTAYIDDPWVSGVATFVS
jgi:hypothetical protein